MAAQVFAKGKLMKLYQRGSVPARYYRPWKDTKCYSKPRHPQGNLVPGLREDGWKPVDAIGFVDWESELGLNDPEAE